MLDSKKSTRLENRALEAKKSRGIVISRLPRRRAATGRHIALAEHNSYSLYGTLRSMFVIDVAEVPRFRISDVFLNRSETEGPDLEKGIAG